MASIISHDDAARFAAIFHGSVSTYGRMSIINGVKTVKTMVEPIPSDAYEKSLAGDGPFLGIVPIREDNTCFFGAIDVDDDGIDLYELEAKIVALRLPLVVCRSKSGGAHLYCFLREAVDARILTDALKKFRSVLNHEKNSNGLPVEIFPKQVKLNKQTGNWINLPYYDHEHTNRYAVTGQRQLSLVEFFDLAVARSTSEQGLLEWADPALGPFKDGPPCLQQWHKQGSPEGGRNNALLNVGIFYRATQPESWAAALTEYNHNMEVPLEDREIQQLLRTLERHNEYTYTCKQHPIEALCQKKPCKKQPFGIAWFTKHKRLAALPELSNLIKIRTDPPRYKLSVNGTVIPCSLDQIIAPRMFVRLVFEKLNLVVPCPKEHEWTELLQQLVDGLQEEDAPFDAGKVGQMLANFYEWLQTRHKSDGVDDVLLGKAALDTATGRVYFRGLDLLSFLQRRNFRDYDANQLYTTLTDLEGLTTEERVVKGAKLMLWSVPEPQSGQSTEQRESFDPPTTRAKRVV